MAEIKVEKKNTSPIWPWIIGILLLIAVVWFLISALGENGEREIHERQQEREAEVEDAGEANLLIPERSETVHHLYFLEA